MNLLAQVPQELTMAGILVSVLTAVGVFLRWYLPKQLDTFERQMQEERVMWSEHFTRIDTTFTKVCDEFHYAVDSYKDSEREFSKGINAMEIRLADTCKLRSESAINMMSRLENDKQKEGE